MLEEIIYSFQIQRLLASSVSLGGCLVDPWLRIILKGARKDGGTSLLA